MAQKVIREPICCCFLQKDSVFLKKLGSCDFLLPLRKSTNQRVYGITIYFTNLYFSILKGQEQESGSKNVSTVLAKFSSTHGVQSKKYG